LSLITHNFLSQYTLADADFQTAIDLAPTRAVVRYWKERNRSDQRHVQIERLFSLSEDGTEVAGNDTKQLILENVIRSLEAVHQYRSQLSFRDLMSEELKGMDFEVVKWSFDYVSPDKYSVTQYTVLEDFPNGRPDWWISIGTDRIATLFDASVKMSQPLFFG
jgi:hypothetical protein